MSTMYNDDDVMGAQQGFNDASSKYTGNAGYQNSIEQASKGAGVSAEGSRQQAAQAARNAGLNKMGAAALGASQGANAYGNSFDNQQSQAASQGQAAVNAAQQNYNNISSERQNQYNRNWTTAGNIMSTVGSGVGLAMLASDERLKNYYNVSKKIHNRKVLSDMTAKQSAAVSYAQEASTTPAEIEKADKAKEERAKDDEDKNKKRALASKLVSDSKISKADYVAPQNALSDETQKTVYGKNDDITKDMAKINAYLFKYKPEAQAKFNGQHGVDGKEHIGVMAQELEKNPVTSSVVETDPTSGFKMVDTDKLTMANTAAISELAKTLEENK